MRRCEFELRSYVVRAKLISSIFWYENGGEKKKQKKNHPKQIRKNESSL